MLKFIEQGLIALCFVLIWKHGYQKGKDDAYGKATEALKELQDKLEEIDKQHGNK